MAIQNRRGGYGDFDPTKLKPGEFAIVQNGDPNADDGGGVYMCFGTGRVKRLATTDEQKSYDDDAHRAADSAEASRAAAQNILALTNAAMQETQATAAEIEQQIDAVSGLTDDIKSALLQCFRNVAWTSESGPDYYAALQTALYAEPGLIQITVQFNQGTAVITPDTPLTALKTYLTVTGLYNNGTVRRVKNYTLAGVLSPGTSTITVTAGTLTATFTVNVTSSEIYEYKLSDGTLAPLVVGTIGTVDDVPVISRNIWNSTSQTSTPSLRRVINVSYGVKPFNIREVNQETSEIQVSPYFPIPIPSDATEATISVEPATLMVNGNIRKYENGIFTVVESAITEVGSISFTFEADENLYFVGQVRDITDTEPTEVVVTFTAPEPYTYKLSDGTLSSLIKGSLTTVDGLTNIIKYTAGGVEYNNHVMNIDSGEQPYILRDYKTDSEYTISTQYPVKIPSDATSATITVTPATLELNGSIRKYENGVFTKIGDSVTGTGVIQFTFEADEHLYFDGQVKDTDAADITDIIVEFE